MWKNKNLVILLAGIFISELGMWFGLIGNLEFLQQQLDSHFSQALILMSGILFGVIIGPYAGRIVDQTPKQKILLMMGVLRILAVVIMLLAIFTQLPWLVLLYSILIGGTSAFYFPAIQSLIPQIVPGDQLVKTNVLNFNLVTFSRIFGAVLAGIMLVYISLYSLYFIALTTYVLLLLSTLMLRIEETIEDSNEVRADLSRKKAFKEVLPLINENKIVKATLILTIIPFIFIGGFNLMVIKISEILDASFYKGLIYAIEGCFIFLAGITATYVTKGRNAITIMLLACLFIGLAQISLILVNWGWISLIAFALFGYMVGIFMPLSNTVCQKEIPKEYLGRFFSLKRMLESLVLQVSLVSTGLLLDIIGFQLMVVILGFGTVTTVLVLGFKQLRAPLIYIEQKGKTS